MKSKIYQAVKILKNGELIAFPTETVYGLGGNAENNDAVIKIFSIKRRPKFNPLICHFKNINSIKKHAVFSKRLIVPGF